MNKRGYILIVFIIIVIKYINSQNVINYYINSNNNNNSKGGNGTITNPYDSICKLKDSLNSSTIIEIPIIVNIGYGYYNRSSFCIVEIRNINNIQIMPYSGSGSDNDEIVEIKNIDLRINHSSAKISNITIEWTSDIARVICLNSSVIFDNSKLDFTSNYRSVWVQISNFTITNKSNFITNKKPGEIVIYKSNLNINGDCILINPLFWYRKSVVLIDNSTLIDCMIQPKDNSSVIISNSIVKRIDPLQMLTFCLMFIVENSSLVITNTSMTSLTNKGDYAFIQTNGLSKVIISDVSFSNFRNFVSVFGLGSGTFKLNRISFENCVSFCLIKTSDGGDVIANITINDIKLIGNGNTKFLEIKDSSLYISNSSIDYLGSSTFNSSIIQFENVKIQTTFTNNLFNLINKSNGTFNDCSFIFNNIEGYGYLFFINKSIIELNACNFTESSSPLVYGNDFSIVKIINSNFTRSYSNQKAFIRTFSSDLQITNIIIDHFSSSNSFLIKGEYSRLYITNLNIIQSSFGNESLLFTNNSDTLITELNISNCLTQSNLFNFISYVFINKFQINNSKFYNNYGLSNSSSLIYSRNIDSYINDCQFIDNTFSPLMQSIYSNVYLENINYQNNSGSFLNSEYGSLSVNNFTMNNSKKILNYLFSISNCSQLAVFSNINIQNNYLNQYLFFFRSDPDSLNNIIQIINLTYTGNIVANLNEDFPFPFEISIYPPPSQFISMQSNVQFISSKISNNIFLSTFFYFHTSSIYIGDSEISFNQFQNSGSLNLIGSHFSSITLENCSILSNFANVPYTIGGSNFTSLMNIYATSITIKSSKIINNQFPLSKGGIINFKIIHTQFGLYFDISNSNFESNQALIGGVYYLENLGNQASRAYFSVYDNTFIRNYAKDAGAVLFTEYPYFNEKNDDSNIFTNNSCSFGENIVSSSIRKFELDDDIQFNDEDIVYKFLIQNVYYNPTNQLSGTFNTSVKIISGFNKAIINETFIQSQIFKGEGTFIYRFLSTGNAVYNITILDLIPSLSSTITIVGCAPLKKYNSTSLDCNYCQAGSTLYSDQCTVCQPDTQTCQFDMIYTHNDYYLIKNQVYQCTLDTCLQNNTCVVNKISTGGDLCYYCFTEIERFGELKKVSETSKNGIQCCSKFKPLLLIPIILVYLIFGITLSIFKYTIFNDGSSIGPIIIFLQTNSVVFYSYRISFLPIFRLSIDFIDTFCLFHGLDYLHKVFISFAVIISLFIISYTDITLKLICFCLTRFKILSSSSLGTSLQRFIKRILIKAQINRKKSIWSIFQVSFIPIVFNSISVFPRIKIDDDELLAFDFSINYLWDANHIVLIIFSILILIIIVLIIISIIMSSSGNNNYQSVLRISKFGEMFSNNFKINQFKWWDIIIMLKSTIFIIMCCFMLFNIHYYMTMVILFQIIYSGSFIVFNTNKRKKPDIIINFFQLIIFVLVGSSLFSFIKPFIKGLVITCLSFSVILVNFLLIHNNSKFRNNKHK